MPQTVAIVLRKAEPQDAALLSELETTSFTTDLLSRRSFRSLLNGDTAETVLASASGRPAGYAMVLFRRNSHAARLYSIAVLPEWKGLGIGRKLLEAAEQAALARGCSRMLLEVRRDNARAIALYRAHGYHQTATLPSYYSDGGDGLRLERQLSSAPCREDRS